MRLTGQSVPRRCFYFSSIQNCNHCPLHNPTSLPNWEKLKDIDLKKKEVACFSSPPVPQTSDRLLHVILCLCAVSDLFCSNLGCFFHFKIKCMQETRDDKKLISLQVSPTSPAEPAEMPPLLLEPPTALATAVQQARNWKHTGAKVTKKANIAVSQRLCES